MPVTKKTPPSPYLSNIKERDIITPLGRKLTLVNPAYMTRQVHELGENLYAGKGHITSLNPIRPENAADSWEAKALQSFEQGETEVQAIEEINGQQYLRLMRPFITEKRCLKCHEHQGYKEEDVRGGISVSVPLEPHYKIAEKAIASLIVWHILILFIGLIGIAFGTIQIRKRMKESLLAKESLVANEERLRYFFENASDLIHSLDSEGRLLYANRLWRETLGYTEDELKKMKVFDIIDTDYQQKCISIFDCMMRGEKTAPTETIFVTKDGRKILVEGRCNLKCEDGKAVDLLGIFRDITDRKKAEVEKMKMIKDLQKALDEVATLRGIIPICSKCKKIRSDDGYWQQVDQYITEHTDAKLTHGICQHCADELYGGEKWYEKGKEEGTIKE